MAAWPVASSRQRGVSFSLYARKFSLSVSTCVWRRMLSMSRVGFVTTRECIRSSVQGHGEGLCVGLVCWAARSAVRVHSIEVSSRVYCC